jgi:hypothetical protein
MQSLYMEYILRGIALLTLQNTRSHHLPSLVQANSRECERLQEQLQSDIKHHDSRMRSVNSLQNISSAKAFNLLDYQCTTCAVSISDGSLLLWHVVVANAGSCSHDAGGGTSNAFPFFRQKRLPLTCGSSQSPSGSLPSSSSSSIASDSSAGTQQTAQSADRVDLLMSPTPYDRLYIVGENGRLRRAILYSEVDMILTKFQFGSSDQAGGDLGRV